MGLLPYGKLFNSTLTVIGFGCVPSNYKLKNILWVSRSSNTHLVIKKFGQMPSKWQLFWETKQPQLPENPSQLSYDLRVAENVVMQLSPINKQKSTVMHLLTIFAILFGVGYLPLTHLGLLQLSSISNLDG